MDRILDRFLNVKRNKSKGREKPHKLILLLACLDWISANDAKENRVLLDERLFDLFHQYWDQLVGIDRTRSQRNSNYPVFHLQSDALGWEVFRGDDSRLKGYVPESTLIKEGAYAKFAQDIWNYLSSEENRDVTKLAILFEYFPEERRKLPPQNFKSLRHFDDEIFGKKKAPKKVTKIEKTEYQRNPLFRSYLLDQYDFTCAISQFRVIPVRNLVQACHIIPFAETGDNSLMNGIALCANLHSAFDNGFIGIGDDYEVIINKSEFEESRSVYSLAQFEGKRILLPENEEFWPSLDFLKEHRKRFKI